MGHTLEKSDGIMVLCSHDLRVASHGAKLFLEGFGNWIIFSGGFGTGPHSGANLNGWTRPEADIFAEEAISLGVPADKVLISPHQLGRHGLIYDKALALLVNKCLNSA